MKLPKFLRLLLGPVLFWMGLLGFVEAVVGDVKKNALLTACQKVSQALITTDNDGFATRCL